MAVTYLAPETKLLRDPVDPAQIGAISKGNEEAHLMPANRAELIGALVVPKFDELCLEDELPIEASLDSTGMEMVLSHRREHRAAYRVRSRRFANGLEFVTRTMQVRRLSTISSLIVVDALSIIQPQNGDYAGQTLLETHSWTGGHSFARINPERVRTYGDQDYDRWSDFANSRVSVHSLYGFELQR